MTGVGEDVRREDDRRRKEKRVENIGDGTRRK